MVIEDFKVLDGDVEKCDHRVSSPNSSILFVEDFITMTYPQTMYGVCKCCGKSFEFIKNEKGKWINKTRKEGTEK